MRIGGGDAADRDDGHAERSCVVEQRAIGAPRGGLRARREEAAERDVIGAGCNGRAVGLSVALGGEFAKAVHGVPENELALPFGEPTPLPLHGLARRVAPLMLIRYRRMDRSEI